MRILQIAVAEDAEAVLAGIRAHSGTAKVVALHGRESRGVPRKLATILEPVGIEVQPVEIDGNVVPAVLRAVTDLVRGARGAFDAILVNVAGGGSVLALATLSAAHLNGARAFAVVGDTVTELPVLHLPLDDVVSESKMDVLRALDKAGGSVDSLQVLADLTGIEKSLLSYHLRGARESRGLEELGLVDIERGSRGRLLVRLSVLGHTLASLVRGPR